MYEINIKEARSHLSDLLDRVERGEEIIILRRGRKIARLIPNFQKKQGLPHLGNFRDSIRMKGSSLSKTVAQLRDEERH